MSIAQRRPGPRPRRHPRAPCSASWFRPALNEGRGRDPGDTSGRTTRRRSWPALNEGRGRDPGDTPESLGRVPIPYALNEGRGRDPGDTVGRLMLSSIASTAQRRPGPRPRRHHPAPRSPRRSVQSLNEGRGRDPGDTMSDGEQRPGVIRAQRRPGPRPRRHEKLGNPTGSRKQRSTKAGAETPATRSGTERPGGRSHPLNEGRGRDPGDTPGGPGRRRSRSALNEGRGRDPGDTGASTRIMVTPGGAQRRPGPRPRRHPPFR